MKKKNNNLTWILNDFTSVLNRKTSEVLSKELGMAIKKELNKTTMNDELFCTYKQAIELRKLGFDEPCYRFQYQSYTPKAESSIKDLDDKEWVGVPMLRQAFHFFKENFDFHASIAYSEPLEIIDIFIELAKKQQK